MTAVSLERYDLILVTHNVSADWELIRNITTSLAAVIALLAAIWKLAPMILQSWDRRTLLELSGEAYSADDTRRYTRNYIQPDC